MYFHDFSSFPASPPTDLSGSIENMRPLPETVGDPRPNWAFYFTGLGHSNENGGSSSISRIKGRKNTKIYKTGCFADWLEISNNFQALGIEKIRNIKIVNAIKSDKLLESVANGFSYRAHPCPKAQFW
jgi:hypothetical protein